MGTPEFAANILEGLLAENYNIVTVVSQPDKEVGRKRILTPSPTKEVALRHNIPVIQPIRIRTDYESVLSYEPDLIITAAYGQIIPEILLNYPKYGCINAHGSLLPKYRGGAPIQWSIINGDKVTGMTIMRMSKGMDEGDIFLKEELLIEIDDTNSTVFRKLSDLALEMLVRFIPDYISGNYVVIKQDDALASYAYNLKKEDEFISFNRDTMTVYNHIRGLLDNPGAYGILKDRKYKFIRVSFELCDNSQASMFKGLENDYLRIDCSDGFIKVYEIKPEGKNNMDAKSFFNGAGRGLVGEYFNG